MGKYNKFTLLVLLLLLVATYLVHHIYETQKSVKYMLEHGSDNKTTFIVDNFVLNRHFKEEGYIKLSALKGFVDRDENRIDLLKCQIDYTKKKIDIYVEADNCSFEYDNKMILKKNVRGTFDNMSFYLGRDGDFTFFVNEGVGRVSGGIVIFKDGNSISASNMKFYKDAQEIYLYKNVRVVYEK